MIKDIGSARVLLSKVRRQFSAKHESHKVSRRQSPRWLTLSQLPPVPHNHRLRSWALRASGCLCVQLRGQRGTRSAVSACSHTAQCTHATCARTQRQPADHALVAHSTSTSWPCCERPGEGSGLVCSAYCTSRAAPCNTIPTTLHLPPRNEIPTRDYGSAPASLQA